MFSFFKKKPPATPVAAAPAAPAEAPAPVPAEAARAGWFDRLKHGLRKTGSSIATVFTGTRIDDALYEDLESALLMADAGVGATAHLLADLKRRVKEAKATDPAAVKGLLADAITDLLAPLQKPLVIGFIVAGTGSFFYALAYIGVVALLGVASYVFILGDVKRVELAPA